MLVGQSRDQKHGLAAPRASTPLSLPAPCPCSPRMKLCLQSRADLTALDCQGPQLLSDATLVSFQSLAPEGSDASFRCIPDPALAERHLAEARQARPLPWGADIPHSCHLPPKSLEVSENGKAGSQGEAQTPNNGRPRLAVRGRPSRGSYTGRCQPEITFLRRKEGLGLFLTHRVGPWAGAGGSCLEALTIILPHLCGLEVFRALRRTWGQRNPDSSSGFAPVSLSCGLGGSEAAGSCSPPTVGAEKKNQEP